MMQGVSGVERDVMKSVSVQVGDCVTLNPEVTEIPRNDDIVWMFGESRIAQIKGDTREISTSSGDNLGFQDKLDLDKQTGSLTIKNIRSEHGGLYKLQIRSTTPIKREFNVSVVDMSGVDTDGLKSLSVLKGDTVPLFVGVTKIQKNDQIRLKFEDQVIFVNHLYNSVDGSWSNILLNSETGDLIISNIQSNHSGNYEAEMNTSSVIIHRRFKIDVSADAFKVSGTTGGSVTLHTNVTIIWGKDQIVWKFKDQVIPAVPLNTEKRNWSWRNIHPNYTTGDLIINNIRSNQFGVYEVEIKRNSLIFLHRKFCVAV
ncbi:uncharacterized protein LOC127159712, partial [Labeo rohita]|uniref:uncharacterized protein LOC127159712 n=1 Tax=Labeo rohita TaxID=84645 RepID=UPI0021E25A77